MKLNHLIYIAGVLLIGIAVGSTLIELQRSLNSLDAVPTTIQEMDQNRSFIPMVEPKASDVPSAPPLPPSTGPASNPAGLVTGGDPATGRYALVPPTQGLVPDRLVIPSIQLNAPIIPVRYRLVSLTGVEYEQWVAPDQFAAGWQDSTALLGVPGNTVLNGHHNAYGEVFKNLVNLNEGDLIEVYSGATVFQYRIVLKLLLPERYQPISVRLANARWIMPTTDERLTLITCWPADSNTHRVVVVAYPVRAGGVTN